MSVIGQDTQNRSPSAVASQESDIQFSSTKSSSSKLGVLLDISKIRKSEVCTDRQPGRQPRLRHRPWARAGCAVRAPLGPGVWQEQEACPLVGFAFWGREGSGGTGTGGDACRALSRCHALARVLLIQGPDARWVLPSAPGAAEAQRGRWLAQRPRAAEQRRWGSPAPGCAPPLQCSLLLHTQASGV